MDETLISSIINNIINNNELDDNVDMFFKLSTEDKSILLNKISKLNNREVGSFLNLIHDKEENKDILKLIKKTIHILKSKGIEVPEPAIKGVSVLKKIDESRPNLGFITNYDEHNSMVALLGIHLKGADYLLINTQIYFLDGLINLDSITIKKADLDDLINNTKQNMKSLVITEVSPKYAYYVIDEASSRSNKFREEVRSIEKFLKNTNYDVNKPEDIYKLPVPDPVNSEDIDKILDHAYFECFSLEWEDLEEDLDRYDDIVKPSIVLPKYMIEENKQRFFNELLESEGIKKILPLFKRTLEHYALIFYSCKEYSFYKGLIKILEDGDKLRDLTLFFIKDALESLYVEDEEDRKEKSLIINPYEKE